MTTEVNAALEHAGQSQSSTDKVREALEVFAKVARHMFVSGHCGGASPEDFPDKWFVHLDIGPHHFGPQQGAPLLTVADFRRADEALASLPAPPSEEAVKNELARFHRNACYPDASDAEIEIAARAIIARLGQQGWQPIETAPKDGTPVDLWVRHIDGPEHRESNMVQVDGRQWHRTCGRVLMSQLETILTPICWMPLPAPPKAS